MTFQDKLKHRFPKQEQKKQIECDPTESMLMNKEQIWQFEKAVNRNLRELRQRCLDEVLGVKPSTEQRK